MGSAMFPGAWSLYNWGRSLQEKNNTKSEKNLIKSQSNFWKLCIFTVLTKPKLLNKHPRHPALDTDLRLLLHKWGPAVLSFSKLSTNTPSSVNVPHYSLPQGFLQGVGRSWRRIWIPALPPRSYMASDTSFDLPELRALSSINTNTNVRPTGGLERTNTWSRAGNVGRARKHVFLAVYQH